MDNLREKTIQAFKKTICKEMGRTGSSLIAMQLLPLAADIAVINGWEPLPFLQETGFQEALLRNGGYLDAS